jgi:AMIN domain
LSVEPLSSDLANDWLLGPYAEQEWAAKASSASSPGADQPAAAAAGSPTPSGGEAASQSVAQPAGTPAEAPAGLAALQRAADERAAAAETAVAPVAAAAAMPSEPVAELAAAEAAGPLATDAAPEGSQPIAVAKREERSASAGPAPKQAAREEQAATQERRAVRRTAYVLNGVEPEQRGDTFTLKVRSNGPVTAYKSFSMSDPPRLVIDLDGQWRGVRSSTIAVDGDVVTGVRVGPHPDKLRIVLDLGASSNPRPTFLETDEGLTVSLEAQSD